MKWRTNNNDDDDKFGIAHIIPDNMLKDNPKKYVVQSQKFCNFRGNPQTMAINKNLELIKNNPHYIEILGIIYEKFQSSPFTTKDLIEALKISQYTDGTLQRRYLTAMVCYGYLIRKRVNYGEGKKFKWVYQYCPHPEPCPLLTPKLTKNGKKQLVCGLDWKNEAEEETYFDL